MSILKDVGLHHLTITEPLTIFWYTCLHIHVVALHVGKGIDYLVNTSLQDVKGQL